MTAASKPSAVSRQPSGIWRLASGGCSAGGEESTHEPRPTIHDPRFSLLAADGWRLTAGFTLVEMLVAIALMGILGIMCWRGLDYVAGQRQRIDGETDEITAVLRVLSQIERDIAQRAPDFILPASSGPRMLPASISVQHSSSGAITLEVVRIAPGAGGNSRAQRIVYRIAESTLTRSASPAGTAWPPAVATEALPLLTGAQRLAVRAFVGGFWMELRRGEAGVQPPVPATGLEVAIEAADGARYVRVFAL